MSKVCRTMSPRRTRPVKKNRSPIEMALRENIERCLYHLVKMEDEEERYVHKQTALKCCVGAQLCLDIIINQKTLLKTYIENYEMQIHYINYLLKTRTDFAQKVQLAKRFKLKVCRERPRRFFR